MQGKEVLLVAQKQADDIREAESRWLEARDVFERNTTLARTILEFCDREAPSAFGRLTRALDLDPQHERRSEFLVDIFSDSEGEAVDVNRLKMRIGIIQVVNRVIEVSYLMPNDRFAVDVHSFFVRGQSRDERDITPDFTGIDLIDIDAGRNKPIDKPVEYLSPEYTFIRKLTGLFIPEVIDQVEQEGQRWETQKP